MKKLRVYESAKINEAMTEEQAKSELKGKELETFTSLMRLGDDADLAYNTVVSNRGRENDDEAYRKAYESAVSVKKSGKLPIFEDVQSDLSIDDLLGYVKDMPWSLENRIDTRDNWGKSVVDVNLKLEDGGNSFTSIALITVDLPKGNDITMKINILGMTDVAKLPDGTIIGTKEEKLRDADKAVEDFKKLIEKFKGLGYNVNASIPNYK